MFYRIFSFLIGFGLTTIGCIYIITYLNLFTMGYNFLDYVNFIIRRYECFYAPIGILIMTFTLFYGGEKDELYL